MRLYIYIYIYNQMKMKKALRETQTLCASCSKAEPIVFALPQTPSRGGQDGQNLISWRWSLPSPTDQAWWKSMHAISNYRGNRHRPPSARHRHDRLQYTAPLCLARSVNNTHKHVLPPRLCGDNLLTSWRCHQRGLSIANHLESTDN